MIRECCSYFSPFKLQNSTSDFISYYYYCCYSYYLQALTNCAFLANLTNSRSRSCEYGNNLCKKC
jgi:hypothetical protein